MKLICFPHYTCGGLLCDILNNTYSPIAPNGGIASIHHSIGKISDTSTVLTEFDVAELLNKLKHLPDNTYAGTHCWPGTFPQDTFEKIINISTATERSRIYRWVRAYNLYYLPQWQHLSGIELTDKCRETAKNYVVPFRPVVASNIYNLEFAEVVEVSAELIDVLKDSDFKKHISRWQQINSFLYDTNFWNRFEVKVYYQAVYELELQKYYVYE